MNLEEIAEKITKEYNANLEKWAGNEFELVDEIMEANGFKYLDLPEEVDRFFTEWDTYTGGAFGSIGFWVKDGKIYEVKGEYFKHSNYTKFEIEEVGPERLVEIFKMYLETHCQDD